MIEADPPSVAADLRRGKEVKNHSVGKGCDARLFDTLGYETCLPDMSALSNFVSLHPLTDVASCQRGKGSQRVMTYFENWLPQNVTVST